MNETNKWIIPECFIDTCFVEVLIQSGKNGVNHQKGNGTVARVMQNEFDNEVCLGIIDEDKQELNYVREFYCLRDYPQYKVLKHKEKNHFFIQIRPVMEVFCLAICEENNIEINDFGLHSEIKKFKKISKSVSTRIDDRFVRLFKNMIRQNCEVIRQLKEVFGKIEEFKNREIIEEDLLIWLNK